MNLLKNKSLKFKLIVSISGLMLVFATATFFAFKSISKDDRNKTIHAFADEASSLSEAIQDQFYERYGDVQAFALNKIVKDLNGKDIPTLFNEYAKLYGIYDLILVVDKNGKYVGSSTIDSKGNNLKLETLQKLSFDQTNWFKSVMAGKATEDKDRGFTGTLVEEFGLDPLMKIATDQDRLSVGFSAAVKNDAGETIGVITCRSNVKWLEDGLIRSYKSMKEAGYPSSEYYLLNKEGVLLISMDPAAVGNSDKIVYDFEKVILKKNIGSIFSEAEDSVKNHKDGLGIFEDKSDNNLLKIGAVSMVDGPKIAASIGWSVLISAHENEVMKEVNQLNLTYQITTLVLLLLGIVVSFLLGNSTSKQVNEVAKRLFSNAKDLLGDARSMSKQSNELSEASTEQASALQETMAAVDEISATIEKNAESSKQAKKISDESLRASVDGQATVDQMLNSIEQISEANDHITEQMNQNNLKIQEIVKLILDIGSKTKVINEIVFQTKLLSFNASVEAARAGEYGKGFSVVAEEVGNLAQMSGNAAKEISVLLEESSRKTNQIVKETEAKMHELINLSKSKVDDGKEKAKVCHESLQEIAKNVKQASSMVSEITHASEEQSKGIREIAKAMGQLDIVTTQNTRISQESSETSGHVTAKSENLERLVIELEQKINGSNKAPERHEYVVDDNQKVEGSHSRTVVKKDLHKKSIATVHSISKQKNKDKNTETPQKSNLELAQKPAAGDSQVPSSNDPRFEEV